MALDAGTRLGPYEITGLLGAGGMGEVYRARDTKLGRDVAIKTLPAAFAADKHRLALFEREAQLLAALNHPHIASIYSLAEHEGSLYLAMELLDGTTLADVIARGAVPVDEALRVALQIASALEAAHGKGVMHRDLKPANVMLARDGQVKVLDFGLAKAFGREPLDASPAHSPASLAMTQQGLVLGTAGYMSPEQASGQASDQRADVWAFGVVLYEMLTGTTLFEGESVTHILAGVLKSEPDWTRLPATLDPRLRTLLERCLTKKPRNRLHSIADARIELDSVLADPDGTKSGARRAQSATPRMLAGAIAATAIVAGVVGWLARPPPIPAPAPVVRLSMPLPSDHPTHPTPMVAVSRDGTRIAYVDRQNLYVRNLSETEGQPVPGVTAGVGRTEPTFSPDGQSLAYVDVVDAAGPFIVKRIPVVGGAPVAVYEAATVTEYPRGLSWPEPDTLMFANHQGVVRLPANGGTPEVLVPRGEAEILLSPQVLPDGQSVLFTAAPPTSNSRAVLDQADIVVASIGGEDRRVLWSGGGAARYLPSGHLLFAQGDALFAIAFDVGARAVRGGPVPMVEGLRRPSGRPITDAANYAIAETGTLAVIPRIGAAPQDPARVETTLTWVDRSGREESLPVRPDDYTMARVSPDGTKIALVTGAGLGGSRPPAIWIYDLLTENLSLLATDPAVNDGPVWSADGRRIFFRAFRLNEQGGIAGSGDVHSIELASGEQTLLGASTTDFPITMPWALVPGRETLALINAVSLQDANLATLSLGSSPAFARLLEGEGIQSEPSFSPDGAWVVYHDISAVNAFAEINVRPFPAVSRTRIPVGRGQNPVFSRDGSELFFVDGEGAGIAVAAVSYEPTLRIGTPRRLFSASYRWGNFGRTWDIDPNGQRFLMIRNPGSPVAAAPAAEVDASQRPRIDVVVNWVQELESRVPSGGR